MRTLSLGKLGVVSSIIVVSLGVVTGAASVAVASSGRGVHGNQPVRSCESLSRLILPDTTITSAVAVAPTSTVPGYCAVKATVTNPPSYTDAVHVGVFLPTDTWNGRFEGIGGGGWRGGDPDAPDPTALAAGYATAGTDAGHPGGSASFALNPDRTLNWQLIDDFGYLGIHNMTVTAKAVVAAYYGRAAQYSYFNGCSTGGRQGLVEVQRYPTDYDGVAAGSPAINSAMTRVAYGWGEMLMLLANDFIPQCKISAVNDAVINTCDSLDGVADGVIGDWQDCRFDASSMIGTVTPCGTITSTDARIIDKIWEGPIDTKGNKIFEGLMPGAAFNVLNNTVTAQDGTTTAAPNAAFFIDAYRYYYLQDPNWDWRTLTYDHFLRIFRQASSEFTYENPTQAAQIDLSAFGNAGGKVVFWAGTADANVYSLATLDYYKRVQQSTGAKFVDTFDRFFLAPGVAHCGGGPGAAPTNAFQAVVNWVEHHRAPSQLVGEKADADGNVVMTRPVCMYPLVAQYKGHGDTNDATSFRCAKSFDRTRHR